MKSPLANVYESSSLVYTNFFGYDCPLYFTSIMQESKLVRQNLGVFDLYHMGRIFLYKNTEIQNLNTVLSVEIDTIKPYQNKGKAKYALILNDRGTIEDDVVIYDYIDKYLLVCNACNKQKLMRIFEGLRIKFEDVSNELMMIAVQGPRASGVISQFFNLDISNIYFYDYVIKDNYLISRSGYTGEDGFEIYSSIKLMRDFLSWVLEKYGQVMCGLGARDTLRIEAGLPLYGNEIDDKTTPIEANLNWAVKVERSFIKNKSLKYFEVNQNKRIPRKQDKVYMDDIEVGFVTSGTFSPNLQKPIGMLYLYKGFEDHRGQYRVKDVILTLYEKPLIQPKYYRKMGN
ncbi:MAG: glycine cleavage T C-terminal barrel domain-containing protein [bacterium]